MQLTQVQSFCHEAMIWKHVHHPHVVSFLGVDDETFSPFLCLVSPWAYYGSIMRFLDERGRGNVDMNLKVRESPGMVHGSADEHSKITQVADGLSYLHDCGVVHGDLRGVRV